MKKIIFLLIAFFITLKSVAQKNTCNNTEKEHQLNSITKCFIKHKTNNNARQIDVRISVSKARYLRKKPLIKKNISGVNDLSTNGVNSLKVKLNETKNRILEISKTASVDEVKKAEKFTTVDRIPNFITCKDVSKNKELKCFNKKMTEHINKYLSYPNQAIIKKIKANVWVRFIISSDGNITNLKTHSPKGTEILEEEAKRVVSMLPKFIPGKKDDKNVSVIYGFPINFSFSE